MWGPNIGGVFGRLKRAFPAMERLTKHTEEDDESFPAWVEKEGGKLEEEGDQIVDHLLKYLCENCDPNFREKVLKKAIQRARQELDRQG